LQCKCKLLVQFIQVCIESSPTQNNKHTTTKASKEIKTIYVNTKKSHSNKKAQKKINQTRKGKDYIFEMRNWFKVWQQHKVQHHKM